MKAVLLEIPRVVADWMEERARLGLDRLDEMWDGVLHMVPAPDFGHQERGSGLLEMMRPLARAKGLAVTYETNVYRPGSDNDYRVPDLVVSSPEHRSRRGVEGRAELVIEIRSPYDESYEKLPFFAEMGIPEVLILEPTDPVLFRLIDARREYERVTDGEDGWVTLGVVEVSFRSVHGRIEVRTPDGIIVI